MFDQDPEEMIHASFLSFGIVMCMYAGMHGCMDAWVGFGPRCRCGPFFSAGLMLCFRFFVVFSFLFFSFRSLFLFMVEVKSLFKQISHCLLIYGLILLFRPLFLPWLQCIAT